MDSIDDTLRAINGRVRRNEEAIAEIRGEHGARLDHLEAPPRRRATDPAPPAPLASEDKAITRRDVAIVVAVVSAAVGGVVGLGRAALWLISLAK